MALWDAVFMTDPKAVKPITGKQYQGNSPKPYFLIQRATEVFGPVGIGWGVTVKSERFEHMAEENVLHVATVSVWYVWEGKRSETIDQMGGTKACYRTSKGALMVDEDAGKKSVTDAMVKCMSMIGFAGDIFSGRWDDSGYVSEANQHYREKEKGPGMDPNIRKEWLQFLDEAKSTKDLALRRDQAVSAAAEVEDIEAAELFKQAAETKMAAAQARVKGEA